MKIGLLPGAFKPPHRGHFRMVKDLTEGGSFESVPYTKESATAAGMTVLRTQLYDKKEPPALDKIMVFVSKNDRDGISYEQSLAIWDIYKKYLKEDVEIECTVKDPVSAAKAYAKANPQHEFYAIVGIRDLSDVNDLKRIGAYVNCSNVKGLAYNNQHTQNYRGTLVREQIENMDNPENIFPAELTKEDLDLALQVIKSAGDDFDIDSLIKEKLEEGSSGAPIQPQAAVKSSDRAKLLRVYNSIRNQLGEKFYDIEFNSDHVMVRLKGPGYKGSQDGSFDYTPYMGSILEYMIDQGHKITPLPEVTVKKDLVESQDFFGKTAYYDPGKKEVVLYVEGRHPKDVMRSFCHEMIHHVQNLEGRLTEVETTDTNASEQLLELEKQAYLEGNLVFRTWEDKVKNEYNYGKETS